MQISFNFFAKRHKRFTLLAQYKYFTIRRRFNYGIGLIKFHKRGI